MFMGIMAVAALRLLFWLTGVTMPQIDKDRLEFLVVLSPAIWCIATHVGMHLTPLEFILAVIHAA